MLTIFARAGEAASRSRTLKILVVALLAVAAIQILSHQRASGHEDVQSAPLEPGVPEPDVLTTTVPDSTPPTTTVPDSTPPTTTVLDSTPPTTTVLDSTPPTATPESGGSIAVPGFDAPPSRAASGPVVISGESNVVIENLHISNPGGTCVTVTDSSNVTIRNSTIGPCGDEAVFLSDVDTARVTGNYISDTGNGVLVHRSDSVAVDGNAFVNAGRNFVQFDKVNGAGSSISGNRGQNELGGSNAEDMINLYQSNGTAGSPIRIVGNHLRNGGPSGFGSGIMLGDFVPDRRGKRLGQFRPGRHRSRGRRQHQSSRQPDLLVVPAVVECRVVCVESVRVDVQ